MTNYLQMLSTNIADSSKLVTVMLGTLAVLEVFSEISIAFDMIVSGLNNF